MKLVADIDYSNPLTLGNIKTLIVRELEKAGKPLDRFTLFKVAIEENDQYRLGFKWRDYRTLLSEMEQEGSVKVRRSFIVGA